MSSEFAPSSTLSPYALAYNISGAPQYHFGSQQPLGCYQAALGGTQSHEFNQSYLARPQQGIYPPTLVKAGQAFTQHVPQANMQPQHNEQLVPLQLLYDQLAWAIYHKQQHAIEVLQHRIQYMRQQNMQQQMSRCEPFQHSYFLPPCKPLPSPQSNTQRNSQFRRSPQHPKGISPSKNPPSLQLNSNESGLPPRHSPPHDIAPSHPSIRSRSLDIRRHEPVRNLSPSHSLPDRTSNSADLPHDFEEISLVDLWMQGLIKIDGVFQENFDSPVTSSDSCMEETYQANTTKAKLCIEHEKTTMSFKHTAVQIKKTISRDDDHLASLPHRRLNSESATSIVTKLFEALKIHSCRAQYLPTFIGKFPKNDLHNHLTGSIYLEEYLNFAVEIGLFYDPVACVFHADQRENSITAKALRDQKEHSEHFKKFRDIMNVHGCSKTATVTDGHKHFFNAFITIESLTAHMPLDRQIVPVVRHARNQEVKYLELMVERLPSADLPIGFEELFNQKTRFTESGLCIDTEVMTFLKPWIDSYVEEQQKILQETNASVSRQLEIPSITEIESPIVVKYLLEIMRDLPNHIFFTRVAAAMALIQHYPHTVGLNIVGPEDDPLAVNNFQDQMRILGTLYEIYGHPNISLHAGEFSPVVASPNMRNHIRDSILIGQAKRIGHGVALSFEELPGVLNLMKTKGTAIEICLTSNQHILKVKSKKHPILTYLKNGIPVIISTDDEAINRSSLTMELMRAIVKYNLSYSAIRKMAFDGVQHSFLPDNAKQALIERINVDINNFENSIAHTIRKVLNQQSHLQLDDQSATARTYKALTV